MFVQNFKNTIGDGGSTALKLLTLMMLFILYTLLTLLTWFTLFTLLTWFKLLTRGMRGTTMGKTGLRPETPFEK